MKTHSSKLILIPLFTVLILLLSACQINFITQIKNDGSGLYTQEVGFQGDEALMSGLSGSGEDFCSKQNAELPPGTTIRQETRNENETWCVYETTFKSIEDLKAIYGQTDTTINNISSANGVFTYDIDLDLSSDATSNMPTSADIYWMVILPGQITENNATEKVGNTLKWKLLIGEPNNIHATSKTGGVSFFNNIPWYAYAGACLCMCGIALVVIGIVVFLVLRRKKKAGGTEPPVETPAPTA